MRAVILIMACVTMVVAGDMFKGSPAKVSAPVTKTTSAKTKFVNDCKKSGAGDSVCDCAYGVMVKLHGKDFDKNKELVARIEAGNITPAEGVALSKCN